MCKRTVQHFVQKKGKFLCDTHENALQNYTNLRNLAHIKNAVNGGFWLFQSHLPLAARVSLCGAFRLFDVWSFTYDLFVYA
jgi:hypothetical protein